jgi:hypothetical protein
MLNEFSVCTQRFGVKSVRDPSNPEEVIVSFENMNQIKSFFNVAMRSPTNSRSIQQIAKDITPSYCCRSLNYRRQPQNHPPLDGLYAQIEKGDANVVLISDKLKTAHDTKATRESGEKNVPELLDFIDFGKKQASRLQEAFTNIVNADYYILEKTVKVDKHTTGAVPGIVDQSSVETYSTGWKAWDDPFEIRAWGVFKGLAAFNLASFMGLKNIALAAAALGMESDMATGQYMALGRSINVRRWYGMFSIRYNLRTGYWEIPWVKYNKIGPSERKFVELTRKDRILIEGKVVYEHPEVMIPPFQSMEDYLADYKKRFIPPEYDVSKPIRLGRFFGNVLK